MQKIIFSAIAAMASNRVIGQNNGLPWDLPEDMNFFREKTRGHPCIMGRKTWDSLGGKPLPKRPNLVITRDPDFQAEGASIFVSLEAALDYVKKNDLLGREETFIIGGEQIYRLSLPFLDRIYLTEIAKAYPGDAYFPEFSREQFKEVSRIARHQPESFDFVTYERC